MSRLNQVTARVDADVFAAAERIIADRKWTMSILVREAVERYVETQTQKEKTK